MNKKSLLIVLIISGLFLFALVMMNGHLLSLAIPFMVYLIIGIVQAPSDVKLHADRKLDKESAFAGEVIGNRVVVKNHGDSLINLWIEDTMLPSINIVKGQSSKRVALMSGENVELQYKLETARGTYSWKKLHACASDPFGLFDIRCDILALGNIIVRPAPLQVRPISFRVRETLPTAGPNLSRQAGLGTDFWGVREYRPGDSLRRVNWRLATRHPKKMFTNEFEREEIADFGLILDARRLSNDDGMEQALFEHSTSAAAALAKNFLRSGNRVSLLVFGNPMLTAFPGYGTQQLDSLLLKLSRAKIGGEISFTNIKHFSTKLFPTRSFLVIFSMLGSRDRDGYAQLRSFGYNVMLISPDPVDFTSRALPSNQTTQLAIRMARVERVYQLKSLLKLGVKVVDWQTSQPLEPLIQKAATQMMHTRNI